MNSLFLDDDYKPVFKKLAMPVKLSQSPEAWQRDIAGEIYKQLPYIGDYAVNVILDKVDAQRGYGFGSIHISNKTDSPLPDQTELPSIRIPVIIRDYLMAPLDIFMDSGGVYPLTEARLREKLFRPQNFELSTRKPPDKGLVDQLYPPMRSNYGMGSLGGDAMGIGKMADAEQARKAMIARMHAEAAANKTHYAGTKCASLIEAISSTIPDRDRDALIAQISNDMEIKVAASKNSSFQKLAFCIASNSHPGLDKTAVALAENIKPNVVQIEKLASGNFRIKWANSNAFNPKEDIVSPKDANQMAGADISGMSPGSSVTVSSEKAKKQSLDEPVFIKIQQFGKYCTQSMDTGQELCGWAIPIVDLDMHPMEMYVFIDVPESPKFDGSTDGSVQSQMTSPGEPGAWSVQDEIAGRPLLAGGAEAFGELVEQNDGSQPQGTGFFLSFGDNCTALVPMTIKSGGQDPTGTPSLMAETMFGDNIQIQTVPGLRQIATVSDGVYSIPEDLHWVPLPGEPTFLVKDPLNIKSSQEAQQIPSQLQVGSTGPGEFSVEGQPISKVAKQDRYFIKQAQAEFLLVAAGVNSLDAKGILKKAENSHEWVKCSATRSIIPLATLHSDMIKKATKDLESFPYHLRQNLVKEASVIDDADTTDKVLAMNFINPENIESYARYLPELDEASKKLAELLLGVRLGIGSVDEGAVERAMKGLETVIDGLKLLQQKVTA